VSAVNGRLRKLRRRGAPTWAPEPPVELPPGRLVHVPGRGELFLRDSGGDGPPLLLLHGWMFPSDLNWSRTYGPLIDAGYRVLAIDHRGHGRGLRTAAAFRLADCADDAAEVIRTIGCGPVTAVGYSMGGPIAQLMARNHPDVVSAIVCCATATDWTERRMRVLWRSMGVLRLLLSAAPLGTWRSVLRLAGFPDSSATSWTAAELSRGSGRDLAEAGRELGRYDSRAWVGELNIPAAVIVTARDRSVPHRKQRELAELLGAPAFEFDGDHDAVVTQGERFAAVLIEALATVAPAPGREVAQQSLRVS
jgi:3-oxoadipate enol-lactonase